MLLVCLLVHICVAHFARYFFSRFREGVLVRHMHQQFSSSLLFPTMTRGVRQILQRQQVVKEFCQFAPYVYSEWLPLRDIFVTIFVQDFLVTSHHFRIPHPFPLCHHLYNGSFLRTTRNQKLY